MILRRIIAHFRKQEWTAIGIDFLIVVIGVFVGIQVSNLNAARIDRALETQYIERLVTDLDTIIATAENERLFEQSKAQQVTAALAMTRERPSDEKSLRLGHLLTLLSIRMSPNFESTTFNDLQNSGRLTLIRNAGLRTSLSAYFARLQYLRTGIGKNNDNYVEPYVSFLREEGIGAGYADPEAVGDVGLTELDTRLSTMSRSRIGARDIHAHSSGLALPPSHPFWERVRAQLTWRGTIAAANEALLDRLIDEASAMRQEIERESERGP